MTTAAGEPDEAARPRAVARDAGTVTAWNVISRVTGFGRLLVIGGALGATRLGDTYHAANQVSNLLFELLAAGTLSAALVPGLVARLAAGDRDRAEALAGALLARALIALAVVGVVGALAARPIMEVLLAGNDTTTKAAQVRIGAFLLLFVMPQLALYAWGAVVTAMLNASGRFASGAAAPVANNVFVMLTMGVFWWRGASGLAVGLPDRVLLGAAALGGVMCMTLVPAVTAARAGIRIAPRLATVEPMAASLREVGWATLVVVPAQLFLAGGLVVASRVPGGVVACQMALALFLLPHAILGHPTATVLYPRIARSWVSGDRAAVRDDGHRGLQVLLLLTAPAGALMVALAPWIVPAISVGALARGAGPAVVAAALMGYALGLMAYSWSLFVTRVSYAVGDMRTPGIAAVAGGVVGAVGLILAANAQGTALLYRVGVAHSAMVAATTLTVLVVLVRRRIVELGGRTWLTSIAAALVVGFAARAAADGVGQAGGRVGAIATVLAGVVGASAIYIAIMWLSGLRLASLRSSPA